MRRADGRNFNELRKVKITPGPQTFAEGSVAIEVGKTAVICAASIEEKVPLFLRGTGSGWVTAEYAMLPRATLTRTVRDSIQGKISGRNQEISRLIGRSLRAITDLSRLGERTVIIDCDVVQADGGTRTAAITGAYVALYQALYKMSRIGLAADVYLNRAVAATSVGIIKNRMMLDLNYEEDSSAEADFNVVMTSKGEYVEIQGTAESKPFTRDNLNEILDLARKGIDELFAFQQEALRALYIPFT